MYILGISCFYHDSAACLLRNGKIIAAVQEERFSRKKHDAGFPVNSIRWCLKEAGIVISKVKYVIFYDKPHNKFKRLLKTNFNYKGAVLFSGHDYSHAASAFYPSPFKEAAIIVLDGIGNSESVFFGTGKDNKIEIIQNLEYPNSLGGLYSAFTYYAGFKINSGEYKLMGLAPFGRPKYKKLILEKIIHLNLDGSFKLDSKYFNFKNKERLINEYFEDLLGAPARVPESDITAHYLDVAASIQNVASEVALKISVHVHKVTGIRKLCLAGEFALNCTANSRILKNGPFKDIWIQPASSDAGCSLGAAMLAWYDYLGNPRYADEKHDKQHQSLLGPKFNDSQIEAVLKKKRAPYSRLGRMALPKRVAELLVKGKIVGWFQGRLEFGPRALGSRSILADSRDPAMPEKINSKVKFRELFRPFAPSVLDNMASKWFDLKRRNPYMLFTFPVKSEKKCRITAITHIDNSARVQTVSKTENPLFYKMIKAFYKLTGCPAIINTSFNIRGEPLVCSPLDALKCFTKTEMDYLIIGSFMLKKPI